MAIRSGDYQRRSVLFDSSSAASSTFTSRVHYMADYRIISAEIPTTLNSGVSLEATNEDGFTVDLNSGGTWSTLTRITAAGVYSVDPGFKYMRARRQSTDSQAAVVVQART